MTDYELVNLYISFKNSAAVSFMNFVTALFALLVAAYVLEDKLTRWLTATAVVLFTLFTGITLLMHLEAVINMRSAARLIQLGAREAGSGLTWIFEDNTVRSLDLIPILTTSTIVISYLSALTFLFYVRDKTPSDQVALAPDSANNSANNSERMNEQLQSSEFKQLRQPEQ